MAYQYKKETGIASTFGEEIYSVPTNKVITLIGCRAANRDHNVPHTFHITVDDVLISGRNTPLPIGSAIDIMVGSKLIIEANSVIRAYSDENNTVDIYISFLEQ